jgi:carbonic anhydrase
MKQLIRGLRKFKTGYFCKNLELFEQLSHGQHPRVLFITCSDSRIDPNLMTQAAPGDLFVIRNAGNLIPPYGSTNGGEGASIEYAIQALDINQIIVCGHSHCGAMKGLLKLSTLEDEMPLVYRWLQHAEATRRLIKENYGHLEGEDLLDVTIAENVLTQIENLRTYPAVHSRLHQGHLSIYAWILDIDTGEVMAYDAETHDYVPPQAQLPTSELDADLLSDAPIVCDIPLANGHSLSGVAAPPTYAPVSAPVSAPSEDYAMPWLSPEQAKRIYQGSAAHSR